MTSRSELDNLPESAWTPFEQTDDYIRSWATVEIDGVRETVIRTQYLADDLLIKANAEEYKDSENKRWGDGRVVARMPLNKWFAELRDSVKAGDQDHLNWWLDQEKNKPFRNFKGRMR